MRRLYADYLAPPCDGKRTPIKAALLDQRVVAGLGNIYVCEALYRAHLSPKRMRCDLSAAARARLGSGQGGPEVLGDAIAGRLDLRDYAKADGELGYFQHRSEVYDREGEPCPRGCKGDVQRIVQAGRSTFFCPVCQR